MLLPLVRDDVVVLVNGKTTPAAAEECLLSQYLLNVRRRRGA
jgi:hypothetical protein